ncbi:NAD(P)H-dependent oxidoreductase [Salirhabdus sp. Marseille-P4669]|uniref:NAD(P)H-dependent oxidoreductase n=1 Tax=Salirhabdus sp. Marseille-P4669 TaxID=2042310 RepID=UPI000C7CE0DC|nr:NAD(P)H-dependent oxidoreductase [Salirhabdus sp. Marseille-P4669]
MKTLLIVSHPDIIESRSQQYFLTSLKNNESVTIHHLEAHYPDGKIDIAKEQALLEQHDRIIFQFPFYWYSAPPLLKQWQDDVLEEGFAHGARKALAGKEFGLVLMIGVSEREYQAGGDELFTISELTRPYQAMAHKVGMIYLRPMSIFQFAYMEDDQKMDTLIHYWQMVTMENNHQLATREKWIMEALQKIQSQDLETINFTIEQIQENRDKIDELKMVLDDMY